MLYEAFNPENKARCMLGDFPLLHYGTGVL